MGRKWLNIIIIITIITSFQGCTKYERGSLEDAKREITKSTGVEISDLEQINTVYNPETEDQLVLNIDGATIYKGDVKTIKAHTNKYFRGYSKKLDSYVFAKYNGLKDQYIFVDNYKLEEKDNASKILHKVSKVLDNNAIEIADINFTKYLITDTNIDNIYKLPKDYDMREGLNTNYLHILINTSSNLDEIVEIVDTLEKEINSVEEYISTHVIGKDGSIVFVYNMRPTIKD